MLESDFMMKKMPFRCIMVKLDVEKNNFFLRKCEGYRWVIVQTEYRLMMLRKCIFLVYCADVVFCYVCFCTTNRYVNC